MIVERTDAYPFAYAGGTGLVAGDCVARLAAGSRRGPWPGAAGFAVSVFVLFFLGRVLQNSYLVWPLAAVVLRRLLAAVVARRGRSRERGG